MKIAADVPSHLEAFFFNRHISDTANVINHARDDQYFFFVFFQNYTTTSIHSRVITNTEYRYQ